MSRRSAVQEGGGGARTAIAALVIVGAAVVMLLLVRASPSTENFDPRSGNALGTRGLVLLLEKYGANVQVSRSVPPPGSDRRVFVIHDQLSEAERADLTEFVRSGGLAVVADPASELTAGIPSAPFDVSDAATPVDPDTATIARDDCDIGALTHLSGAYVPAGVRYTVPAGATACFGRGATAYAVAVPLGEGTLVALGGNLPFANAYLRYADNAAMATALLAPVEGTRVTIVLGTGAAKTAADIGSGETTLFGLVRPGVWMALAQLAVAFVLLALARAIRPGRPVREPEQVPVAGSELVAATGNLMQRAGHAQKAGWLLRGRLYRALCRRLRLPPTVPIADLDAAAARQLGLAPGSVAAVLDREARDDASLVRLAADLEQLRAAVFGAPTAPRHEPDGDDRPPDRPTDREPDPEPEGVTA